MRLLALALILASAAAVTISDYVSLAVSQNSGDRVFGGADAIVDPPFRYKFFVQLVMQTGSKYELCGGTLITPSVVLTAAHCFSHAASASSAKVSRIFVYIGHNYRCSPASTPVCADDMAAPRATKYAASIAVPPAKPWPYTVHEAFTGVWGVNPATGSEQYLNVGTLGLDNDIALVFLERPAHNLTVALDWHNTAVSPGATGYSKVTISTAS